MHKDLPSLRALPTKTVTLATISEACNVSIGAVSQVLKNPDSTRFSEKTRTLILQTVKELGYRPNRTAQALRSGRNRLIALVTPWNTPELLDQIEITARKLHYGTMLQFTFSPDSKHEKEALLLAIERQVEGIIWIPGFPEKDYSDILQLTQRNGIELVFIDWTVEGISQPHTLVQVDYLNAIYQSFEIAEKNGFGEVVLLLPPRFFQTWRHNVAAIKQYLQSYALPSRILTIDKGVPPHDDLWGSIGDCSNRPLLFSWVDWVGMWLIGELRGKGMRVPEDVGIVNLGDLLLGNSIRPNEMFIPSISAVRRPSGAMGEIAVKSLVERIEDENKRDDTQIVSLTADYIDRESTAARAREAGLVQQPAAGKGSAVGSRGVPTTTKQSSKQPKQKARGFSLIELLVSLAVVLILLSLTVSVVSRVRLTADRAKCQMNLRQLHTAAMTYIQETGLLPYRDQWYNYSYAANAGFRDYFTSVKTAHDDNIETIATSPLLNRRWPSWSVVQNTYAMNNRVGRRDATDDDPSGMRDSISGLHEIEQPSRMLHFMFASMSARDGGKYWYTAMVNNAAESGGSISNERYYDDGYSNIVYMDGHVDRISRKQGVAMRKGLRTSDDVHLFWLGRLRPDLD